MANKEGTVIFGPGESRPCYTEGGAATLANAMNIVPICFPVLLLAAPYAILESPRTCKLNFLASTA